MRKNKLTICLLLLSVVLFFTNCSEEYDINNKTNSKPNNSFVIKNLNKNDLIKNLKVVEKF